MSTDGDRSWSMTQVLMDMRATAMNTSEAVASPPDPATASGPQVADFEALRRGQALAMSPIPKNTPEGVLMGLPPAIRDPMQTLTAASPTFRAEFEKFVKNGGKIIVADEQGNARLPNGESLNINELTNGGGATFKYGERTGGFFGIGATTRNIPVIVLRSSGSYGVLPEELLDANYALDLNGSVARASQVTERLGKVLTYSTPAMVSRQQPDVGTIARGIADSGVNLNYGRYANLPATGPVDQAYSKSVNAILTEMGATNVTPHLPDLQSGNIQNLMFR